MSLSMGTAIKRDQSHAPWRVKQAKRLSEVGSEAVLKHKGDATPFVPIMKMQAIVIEEGHQLTFLFTNLSRKRTEASTSVSSNPCKIKGPWKPVFLRSLT